MKRLKEFLDEKKQTDTISVFDLDDALIFSKSKIKYLLPGDTTWQSISTLEFAKIRGDLPEGTKYDLSDFSDYVSAYTGIVEAKPNIPVLKKLDDAVNKGHKIGILTARQNQTAVLKGVMDKLLYRDKSGKLKKIPSSQFKKRWIFAISDKKTSKALIDMGAVSGGMMNPQDLKAFVLEEILLNKEGFKQVIYYDDDLHNINTVKNLNNPKIKAIKV